MLPLPQFRRRQARTQREPQQSRQQLARRCPFPCRARSGSGCRPASFFCKTPRIQRGVCVSICFCHPPSILPTSTSGWDSSANFLLSRAFNSQAICKKNLSVSSLMLAFCIIIPLCSFAVKPAVKISSLSSINRLLIFSPRE